MPDRRFTLDDVRGICVTPFIDRETRAEQARQADLAAEAARAGGVRWSGLAAQPSRPPRDREQVRVDAEAAWRRAARFAESPRGRFLLRLRALEDVGYTRHAETARAAFARGLGDPEQPPCVAEIGCALSALARLDHPDARGACLALAELLTEGLGMAAE